MTISQPTPGTSPHDLDTTAREFADLFNEFGFEPTEEQVRDALCASIARMGLGPDITRDSDPDPDPNRLVPSPPVRAGLVPFGYRIQTRTRIGWRTARTGTTWVMWRPTQTALDSAARTILRNAGPVLGLGPKDPMPTVRVRTWHSDTGLSGSATSAQTGLGAPRTRPDRRRVRQWRLRLAALIAPAGADVHDPDDTECPDMTDFLESVLWGHIERHRSGGVWADNTAIAEDAEELGLIEKADQGNQPPYRLTAAGERALAAAWGPGRVPPWSGGYHGCADHGVYDAGPGDPGGCPQCPTTLPSRSVFSIRSRVPVSWSLRARASAARARG
jgi:hypothetical protein